MNDLRKNWHEKYGRSEYVVLRDLYEYMNALEEDRDSFSHVYYEFFRMCEEMLEEHGVFPYGFARKPYDEACEDYRREQAREHARLEQDRLDAMQ